MKTGAVILAAGGSTRLGRPKQFLTLEGKTLLRRAVEAVAGCSPIVVVAGRDSEEVENELRQHTVWIVRNDQWAQGIGTSIRAGVNRAVAVVPDLGELIILVCDQPYVSVETIAALRTTRQSAQKSIAACEYGGSMGVPAVFSSAYFLALKSLSDERGAKEIIRRAGHDVATLAFPQGVCDIDTEADVLRHLIR